MVPCQLLLSDLEETLYFSSLSYDDEYAFEKLAGRYSIEELIKGPKFDLRVSLVNNRNTEKQETISIPQELFSIFFQDSFEATDISSQVSDIKLSTVKEKRIVNKETTDGLDFLLIFTACLCFKIKSQDFLKDFSVVKLNSVKSSKDSVIQVYSKSLFNIIHKRFQIFYESRELDNLKFQSFIYPFIQ